MPRMSRSSWFANFFRPTLGRKPSKRGTPGKSPKVGWIVLGCGTRFEVMAVTRSEARAEAKRALGIRKGRLPLSGCVICKHKREKVA
jgi:hypothetical protein